MVVAKSLLLLKAAQPIFHLHKIHKYEMERIGARAIRPVLDLEKCSNRNL